MTSILIFNGGVNLIIAVVGSISATALVWKKWGKQISKFAGLKEEF